SNSAELAKCSCFVLGDRAATPATFSGCAAQRPNILCTAWTIHSLGIRGLMMKASVVLRDVAHAEGVQGAVDNFVDKRWKGGPSTEFFPVDGFRDRFQNDRGISVHLVRERDEKLTAFGKATLDDRYLLEGESYQDLFARVAAHFADDSAHAQ